MKNKIVKFVLLAALIKDCIVVLFKTRKTDTKVKKSLVRESAVFSKVYNEFLAPDSPVTEDELREVTNMNNPFIVAYIKRAKQPAQFV